MKHLIRQHLALLLALSLLLQGASALAFGCVDHLPKRHAETSVQDCDGMTGMVGMVGMVGMDSGHHAAMAVANTHRNDDPDRQDSLHRQDRQDRQDSNKAEECCADGCDCVAITTGIATETTFADPWLLAGNDTAVDVAYVSTTTGFTTPPPIQ